MAFQLYETEENRRISYLGMGNLIPNQELMAKSGFFYYGGMDTVQCFTCGLKLHLWEHFDIPDLEHLIHSPECSFIRHKLYNNNNNNLLTEVVLSVLSEQMELKKRLQRLEDWVTGPGMVFDELGVTPQRDSPQEVPQEVTQQETESTCSTSSEI